jgi:hypothetical protein
MIEERKQAMEEEEDAEEHQRDRPTNREVGELQRRCVAAKFRILPTRLHSLLLLLLLLLLNLNWSNNQFWLLIYTKQMSYTSYSRITKRVTYYLSSF